MAKNTEFYLGRARINFLTGHYEDCLNDIEEVSKDPANKNTLLIIKGLALDRVEKYWEADQVFYQLETLSKEPGYLVHAAIENRKAARSR